METKKPTTEIAFAGEVQPANCECHKGQWACVAWLVHPIQGRVYMNNAIFETKAEATKELDGFVMAEAKLLIAALGLDPKDAHKIEFANTPAKAEKLERDFRTRNNPNLH